MKKLILTTLLIIAAAGSFAEETKQTTCPVMGGKINKELFVDTNGYRIYVCCKGCIAAVKADPEKYIKKMKAEGIELEKVTVPQTTCPVMGKEINKKLYVDADGYRIYVCCKKCLAAVKANPKKYIEKLQAQGVNLEKTPASPTKDKPDEEDLPDSIIRYRLHGDNPATDQMRKSDPSGFRDMMKGLGIPIQESNEERPPSR